MKKNYPTVELTREQLIFLKGFEPDKSTATRDAKLAGGILLLEEGKLIDKIFGLDEADADELVAIKNTIVLFYFELREKVLKITNGNTNALAREIDDAMVVITEHIDLHILLS